MSPSQFAGGPLDGEVREIKDEPMVLFFPQQPDLQKAIREPDAPPAIVDHRYEKRAAGAYYEYTGTRTR